MCNSSSFYEEYATAPPSLYEKKLAKKIILIKNLNLKLIIEVGCGGGQLIHLLNEYGAEAIGIDGIEAIITKTKGRQKVPLISGFAAKDARCLYKE